MNSLEAPRQAKVNLAQVILQGVDTLSKLHPPPTKQLFAGPVVGEAKKQKIAAPLEDSQPMAALPIVNKELRKDRMQLLTLK